MLKHTKSLIWALILLPCGRHGSRDSDLTCGQDKIITWLQGLTLCSHYLFPGCWKMFHVWSWETSPGCTDVWDGSTKLKTDLPQERCTMWLPPPGQGPGQVSWSVGLSSLEIVRTTLSLGHHPSSTWYHDPLAHESLNLLKAVILGRAQSFTRR